jgi:hypothetical protein
MALPRERVASVRATSVRFFVTLWLVAAASVAPACADAGAGGLSPRQRALVGGRSSPHWLIRTSRLVMPYGMRLPKHHLYVRDVTRAQREAHAGNVLPRSPISVRHDPMAVINENKLVSDRYRERGYAAFAEYAFSPGLAAGASALVMVSNADRLSFEQEKTWHRTQSLFVRVRVARPLSFLAELELAHSSRRARGYAGLVQLDYQPLRGLHLLCSGELTRRTARRSNDDDLLPEPPHAQRELLPGAWLTLDWLASPHFEARFDAIARLESGMQLLARFNTYF